ncbi:mannose-1-phosphate guanylyltransferase [Spirochaeta isovalerica]|uniref:Mannose-1-phosphate guanylyltransferase/mannose-6-phosphate isomerase n=1 Tax=Spirochaeta isovalerica TaxID=150 RepID=A0A841RBN4_9SPIO|nr:sugar phosphate nucleotidyltransferase [Spirochaeta isovalerica]MBB6480771.1 mannose-1-phosphate guanylyltransferase/mannose-6-phosphate isomerase [Spirochaeta isovalerica]
MIDHVIIMAGGAGTRLWPASTNTRPKQFMKIGGNDSLITSAIKRGFALDHRGYVIIVTHRDHLKPALDECSALPEEMRKRIVILPEPFARNTAPALMLAAAWLKWKGEENSSVIVLAADHIINDTDGFIASVEKASQLAEKDRLVPFGIPPVSAETGYGYIEAGKTFLPGLEVVSFKEKPDLKTAVKFVAAGNFYWNSGMFVYPVSLFYDELRVHTPEVVEPFDSIDFRDGQFAAEKDLTYLKDIDAITPVYEKVLKISIDYALMEKSHKIAMAEAEFDWNDVGSWDVISEIDKSEKNTLTVKGRNNFVYGDDVQVAFCGVSDLIVVVEEGKILICRKGESQLVKEVTEKL